MRAFTGNEDPKELFEELHRLLDRVGVLLLHARKEHEQAVAFIGTLLLDTPTGEDIRQALIDYKAGKFKPLQPFGDSVR